MPQAWTTHQRLGAAQETAAADASSLSSLSSLGIQTDGTHVQHEFECGQHETNAEGEAKDDDHLPGRASDGRGMSNL